MRELMNNKWTKQINNLLVGKTIKKVEWLNADESYRLFGWHYQPCEIHLDDGTILTPSADDEGNNAGAIFTNNEIGTLHVERYPVSEKTIKKENEKFKKMEGVIK
jgi:hypothetical protein